MHNRQWFILLIMILSVLLFVPVGFGQEGQPTTAESQLLPAEYDTWSCDWSPDGKTLVFTGKIKGEDSTRMRVWLWSPPNGTPAVWTNTPGMMDVSPKWSPQGDGVVMVRRSLADIETNRCLTSSLWWKAYPSGDGVQITTGPEDKDPSWSPDGKSLVFVQGNGPFLSNLAIVTRTGQNFRVLTTGNNFLADPFWASDGWIYYTRYLVGNREMTIGSGSFSGTEIKKGIIERINPVNGRIESVVQDEFDNRAPSVSRDGKLLAFISTRNIASDKNHIFDRAGLWVMDLQQRKILKNLSEQAGLTGTPPVWSPQGDKITYFSFRFIRPSLWITGLESAPAPAPTVKTTGN